MIQRITKRIGDRPGPGAEFFEWLGVSGAIALRHAIGPHRPPLVVIAFKPKFGQVVEPTILGDVLWSEVAVIIKDRLLLGVIAIEPARGLGMEQEILVDEFHKNFWNQRSGR